MSTLRRFYILEGVSGCTGDKGWLVVLDAGHSNWCSYEDYDILPVFLYNPFSTKTDPSSTYTIKCSYTSNST